MWRQWFINNFGTANRPSQAGLSEAESLAKKGRSEKRKEKERKKENCTYWSTLSTPKGLKLSFLPSTGSHFQDTGRFSKFAYLGMKLGDWEKFQKLHIYSLSTPEGEIKLSFALRAAVLEIRENFQNFHIWA